VSSELLRTSRIRPSQPADKVKSRRKRLAALLTERTFRRLVQLGVFALIAFIFADRP